MLLCGIQLNLQPFTTVPGVLGTLLLLRGSLLPGLVRAVQHGVQLPDQRFVLIGPLVRRFLDVVHILIQGIQALKQNVDHIRSDFNVTIAYFRKYILHG